jgi:hypothetical protein
MAQCTAQQLRMSNHEAKNSKPWYSASPAATIMVAKRRALHVHVAKNTSPWNRFIAVVPMRQVAREMVGGPLPKGQYPFQSKSNNADDDISAAGNKTSDNPATDVMPGDFTRVRSLADQWLNEYYRRSPPELD